MHLYSSRNAHTRIDACVKKCDNLVQILSHSVQTYYDGESPFLNPRGMI